MSTPPCIPYRIRQLPDLLDLTEYLGTPNAYAWTKNAQGAIGVGEAASFSDAPPGVAGQVATWWREVMWHQTAGSATAGQNPPAPIGFVSLPFDPHNSVDRGGVVVAEVTIFTSDNGTWLLEAGESATSDMRPVDEVLAASFVKETQPPGPATDGAITFTQGQLSAEQWRAIVESTTAEIKSGAFIKAVLARDTIACSTKPWKPGNILRQLAAAFPSCWTYSWGGLLGATPELLARQSSRQVMSRVLAGSAPQNGNPDHNFHVRQQLADSTKDQHEHQLAVDSVEDVFRARQLTLTGNRSHIIELRNVAHIATDVHASTDGLGSILDLIHDLHPTAAVGGTPRKEATEWIRSVERMDRGRYAGPVGWVGADGHGEVGLALRCGQLLQPCEHGLHQLQLFAGCGIVSESDSGAEVAESEAKFDALRTILTATECEGSTSR